MEVVKFQQAQLINFDLDMYYAKTDTPALCRTSSLVEDLGQIEYVFSDKTGTLTCNEMEFRCCSIAGTAYADVVDEAKRDGDDGRGGWKSFAEMRDYLNATTNPFLDQPTSSSSSVIAGGREREIIQEFLTLLAVCHTVIPEVQDGKIVYQASSPDEAALVAGAELLGYQFHVCHFFTGVYLGLTLFPDTKTKIGVREYSGTNTRIRDIESLRIQFHPETDVYSRQGSRRKGKTLYQRGGHCNFGTAEQKPAIYGGYPCPS
jgi:hypothetical protein